MIEVSVVGADGAGKSSLVNAIASLQIENFRVIHLTSCKNAPKGFIGNFGKMLNQWTQFAEKRRWKLLTGLGYFLYLIPYFFLEKKLKKEARVLISDRDPTLDTLCHMKFYLPACLYSALGRPIAALLRGVFKRPNAFWHLQASLETIRNRDKGPLQIHELDDENSLFIANFLGTELAKFKTRGVEVYEIQTDGKSIDEVLKEFLSLAPLKNAS